MAKDQRPLSGFRDILAGAMLVRQQVLDKVTATFELYGFMPIKTPALERFETLNGKYGEEATALMYDFKDHGQRHLALRYDHTVPLARLMASQGGSLQLPYRRYVVGDVWRGESPQAGRYREFTQIDADIVGSSSYLADCEVLAMMHDIFKALELKVTILLNDRRLLDGLAASCGLSKEADVYHLIGLIDKTAKVGPKTVIADVRESFGDAAAGTVSKLLDQPRQSIEDVARYIKGPKAQDGLSNLKQILDSLEALGLGNVIFNPTIARGLNYYTSTIYEVVIDDRPQLGSVCAGGRYDRLLSQLGGPDLPAIGTSIGLDRLMDGLGDKAGPQTKTMAYLANLDKSLDSYRLKLAHSLRQAGLPVEMYYEPAKLGKQLAAASKAGVDLVIIYGPNEQQKDQVLIKNLKTSDQEEVKISQIVEVLQGR